MTLATNNVTQKEIDQCLEILSLIRSGIKNQLNNVPDDIHLRAPYPVHVDIKRAFKKQYTTELKDMLNLVDDMLASIDASIEDWSVYRFFVDCLLYTYNEDPKKTCILFDYKMITFNLDVSKNIVESFTIDCKDLWGKIFETIIQYSKIDPVEIMSIEGCEKINKVYLTSRMKKHPSVKFLK